MVVALDSHHSAPKVNRNVTILKMISDYLRLRHYEISVFEIKWSVLSPEE